MAAVVCGGGEGKGPGPGFKGMSPERRIKMVKKNDCRWGVVLVFCVVSKRTAEGFLKDNNFVELQYCNIWLWTIGL
jgi:hypothetical protein